MSVTDEPFDANQYPCPRCGAVVGEACAPLRKTGFVATLRPHRERGMYPFQLTADGKARR